VSEGQDDCSERPASWHEQCPVASENRPADP
jgi:hypothetical protein